MKSRRFSIKGVIDTILPAIPLVLVNVFVRIVYSREIWTPIQGDAGQYFAAAKNLATNGYLGVGSGPDALRPPLFSILFAAVSKLFHLEMSYWDYTALNCAIDALSTFLLYLVARRISPGWGFWGVLFVSLSPLWIGHVNSPITEPLSVLCFLIFFERWIREDRNRKDEFIAGIAMGCLTLSRSMYFWFPIGLLIWEWILPKAPKGAKTLELRPRLAFLGGSFLPPVLWGVRNAISVGRFLMTQDTTTAILMAWLFIKLPLLDWRTQETVDFHNRHPWGDVLVGRASSERTQEIFGKMREEVIDMITHHPWEYLKLMGPKYFRLWVGGWWNPYNYVYSPPYLAATYIWVFCLPILVFGCYGLYRQWSPISPARAISVAQWRATRTQVFLCLYTSAVVAPFTVDARYSLIAYVCFSLWFGLGLATAFPNQSHQPTRI